MLGCLGINFQRQIAIKHIVLCRGCIGLSLLAIVGLGLLPRAQAAENTLLNRPVSAGLVTLRGNTRPEANAKNDRGRVSDDLVLNHMMLQLRRSPEQEQALEDFINQIHDPASPLFHQWITAAEFGQRFGVPQADVDKVTDWLESQGFTVNLVYPNQMVIDFTGTAGQIRQAFHTEIHNLMVKGQAHIANMSDPQIPAELAATVAGVVSLNDFRPHPTFHPRFNYTYSCGTNCNEYPLVPADLAKIYNFNPAFSAGYSGQGQTVVLIEDTDLYTTADWTTFRSTFGLTSAYPSGNLTTVHPGGCADPGVNGDDGEAIIDVEWASAAAPSATIELASCADSAGGLFTALANLVSSGTPPAIVSMSYDQSESLLGAASNAYINSLYQQAVTEGVSIFVSAGDSGAADTDHDIGDTRYAEYGIAVSGFTSTPYNVSVGGTDFADSYQNANSTYWSSSNASNYGSALSYIPEVPWNSSCASVLLGDYLGFLPTYSSTGLCSGTTKYETDFLDIAAGGGGPSSCASGAPDIGGLVGGTCAGYAKPSWQSLVGNPSDGVRDIPDVSLFASAGPWGHYYVFCFSDPSNGGAGCTGAPSTWNGAGGTSFAAPIWAAIQSLINQASGSRWGNPNPAYYSLATAEYGFSGSTSCSSALGNTVSSKCIFYDVTPITLLHGGSGTGGDNNVPCYGMNCYDPSGTYGVLSTAPQPLSSVIVTDIGGGYSGALSCTLTGGSGSGATCSAFTTGVVTGVSIVNGGSGYTTQPTCALTGGGGSGAACVVTSATAGGVLNGIVLTAYGSGYTSAPTCTITSNGSGLGATCAATEGAGIGTTLSSPGSGYTTLPYCTIGLGIGATGSGGTCAALAVNTSDAYTPAFTTNTGWDFPTGIGTPNVTNLVNSFTTVTVSPLSLTFGNQAEGTTSAADTVTVTNGGTEPLAFTSIVATGNFAIAASGTTCSTSMTVAASGGNCVIKVTFSPTATGSLSGTLTITDNATPTVSPYGTPQTVSLSGTGTAALASQTINVTTPAPASAIYNTSFMVAATASSGLTVSFSSTGVCTNVGATFTMTSGTGTCTVKFDQAGNSNYSAAPEVTESVTAQPASQTINVTTPAPASAIYNTSFMVAATGGGSGNAVTFSSGGICTNVGATFTMTSGTGTCTVKFDQAGNSNYSAAPEVTESVTAQLASQTINVTTPAPGSAIYNTSFGVAATASSGLTVSFSAGGVCTNANATFTMTSGTGTCTVKFEQAGNSNYSTAPEVTESVTAQLASQTINVTTPAPASAVYTTSFTVAATASSGLTVSFSSGGVCTNVGATFTMTSGTGTCTVKFDQAGNSNYSAAPEVTESVTAQPAVPVVSLSSSSLTFPAQIVGISSSAQTVKLTNTGYASLAISSISAGGGFSQTNTCGTTVSVSANCTISVTFKPTATGTWTGTVSIWDNAAGSPQSVALSGTGVVFTSGPHPPIVPQPPLEPVPGKPIPGLPPSLPVTEPISVPTPGQAPPTSPPVIGPTSVPAPGQVSPTSPPVTGPASGQATVPAPGVSLAPSALSFSAQLVGTRSSTQTVTLANMGSGTLTLTAIATSANFGQTNNCGGSVAPRGSCTINVTFLPMATGALAGTLTITGSSHGVAGSTQTVTLSGTGVESVVR